MQDRDQEAADVLRGALAMVRKPGPACPAPPPRGRPRARGRARPRTERALHPSPGERRLVPCAARSCWSSASGNTPTSRGPWSTTCPARSPWSCTRAMPATGVVRSAVVGRRDLQPPDGRIRVGTADLSAGLAGLEELLTHELAHAFIGSRTGGNFPPDDRRRPVPVPLRPAGPARRDSTRAPWKRAARSSEQDFYEAALSFVEYLLRRHGQPAMNDHLEAFGKTDSDRAFRKAYGTSYAEARKEWLKRLP